MNMRVNLLVILSFSALVCLAGCATTTSHTGEPSGEPPSRIGVYDTLISQDQAEIVEKAQQFIHARHPGVDPDFPNIHIRSAGYEGFAEDDPELHGILQSLSSGILGARPNAPTWELDVKVQFHPHEPSKTTVAMIVVPELAICFSTIFIICPAHYDEEVVMQVQVTLPDGRQAQFVSAGYGDLYESTAMLEDNDKNFKDKMTQRNTGGLVAAIVGSADKLVDTYKDLSKK